MVDLRVVARPSQVADPRSTAGQELAQLSQSLRQFNPSLDRIAQKAQQKFEEEQSVIGANEALKSAQTYAEAVKAGTLKFGENPFAQKAYREQIGRNTGLRLSSELERAYLEWDGKDNDDPAAVQEFISGFIAEQTEDISDTEVITGLQSTLATTVNNLQVKHRSYTVDRVATGYAEGIQTELMSLAGDALVGGTPDTTVWNAGVDAIKAEAVTLGLPRSKVDELVIQAVAAKALADLDVAAFDLLDIPRSDGTPPISSKPAAIEQIAQARDQVLRYAWRVSTEGETEETEAQKAAEKEWEARLIDAAFAGEGITQEMREDLARSVGTQKASQMLGQINSVAGSSSAGRDRFEDEDELDRANYAAYIEGDVDFIRQMILEDRIPPGLRASYLNAADTQRRQIVSGVRSETRFDERAAAREGADVQTAIERGRTASGQPANGSGTPARDPSLPPSAGNQRARLLQIKEAPQYATLADYLGLNLNLSNRTNANRAVERSRNLTTFTARAIETHGEEKVRADFDLKYGAGAFDLFYRPLRPQPSE